MAMDKYCQWPPDLRGVEVENLGYVEDVNGCTYYRDIGRSSSFEGIAIFQFGDTFVHDITGNFVGLSEANFAVVNNFSKPAQCMYQVLMPDWMIPNNPALLDTDLDNDDYRTTTWCFGGIVWPPKNPDSFSISPTVVEGYTYFQNSHINKHQWQEKFQHVGIAKVLLDTLTHEVTMSRDPHNDVLFQCSIRKEPRFGSFTAVYNHDDGHVYAYGHAADNSKDVMLARVLIQAIQEKVYYEYYDGQKFQGDMSKCKPVFTGMQHGSIYRSKLFPPNSGKDWVFIGCTAFADNQVQIGVAARPEGPWDIKFLMAARPNTIHLDQRFSYCMYAHPWAYDEANGQVMITWSEGGMQGKVVAVKVSLPQVLQGHEKESEIQVEELIEFKGMQEDQSSQKSRKSLKKKVFGALKINRKRKSLEDAM